MYRRNNFSLLIYKLLLSYILEPLYTLWKCASRIMTLTSCSFTAQPVMRSGISHQLTEGIKSMLHISQPGYDKIMSV